MASTHRWRYGSTYSVRVGDQRRASAKNFGTGVKGRSERVRRGQIPLPPSGFELRTVHYVRVATPTELSEPCSLR